MPAKPFRDLPKIMARIARRSDRALKRTMHQTALEVDRVAVRETPVDTGLARSNWIATIGAPATGTIPAYAPGKDRGKGERANAGPARAQAAQVIKGWQTNNPNPITLANNVAYITLLDKGGPKNLPNNMTALAVQAGTKKVLSVFRKTFRASGIDRLLRI